MATKGDWSDHDNKKYIGKLDRIYVSLSETWEVEYFIDHYLESRNCSLTTKNRNVIANKLEEYSGKAPYKRDDLKAFLDANITVSK